MLFSHVCVDMGSCVAAMGRCIFRVCGLVPRTFFITLICESRVVVLAMIKCMDCGQDISDSSKKCTHCGCPTVKSIRAEKERINQEQWNNTSPTIKKISTIVTVAILVLIAVCLFKACSGIDTEDNYNTEGRAIVCAEMAVEDRLKSPSTADFCPSYEMTVTNLGGDTWKVTGYVDAQNSFGAEIREYWTVTLTLTETGYKNCSVSFS